MHPRHFQIFSSRSLPAKSLMELRSVLDDDSAVNGVPFVADAADDDADAADVADGVLYGVHAKLVFYSSCMIPPVYGP